MGLAVCFVCFSLGYFFGGRGEAGAYTVEAANSAGEEVYIGGDAVDKDASENSISARDIPESDTETSPDDAPGEEAGGLININTADAEALQTLPGIGEVLAERIIEYRETNGPFTDIIEITGVSGIGEGIFDNICDYITIGG